MDYPVPSLPEILDPVAIYHLTVRVQRGQNILVCGGAGGGKTTVVRALAQLLPEDAFIGTAEDRPELNLTSASSRILARTRLQTQNQASIAQLVDELRHARVNTLFMSEIRNGGDALAFLETCGGGTQIIAEVHASDPATAVERLLLMGSFEHAYERLHALAVRGGIDTIVHVERPSDQGWHSRREITIHDMVRQPGSRPKVSTGPLTLPTVEVYRSPGYDWA